MAHVAVISSSSPPSSTSYFSSPPHIFLCSSYGVPSSSSSSSPSFSSFNNHTTPPLLRSRRKSFGSSSPLICTVGHSQSQNRQLDSNFVCSALPEALFFDCDGVLVDTERDGHRVSFNQTFSEKGLGVDWDVDLYGELLKIGGGKERITAYFNKQGWPAVAPATDQERKEFVASLHKRKTVLFMELIEKKLLPLRPGVARLIDEALTKGVKVAVCSTSNELAVSSIVNGLLGPERGQFITIFAGDIVPKKKPDPAIYVLAANSYSVNPAKCIVIEDSAIGLAAAKGAGMKCIVTKSGYTAEEDFENADAVFDCIGDPPNVNFGLDFCSELLKAPQAVKSI